jgi:hypothetical protein
MSPEISARGHATTHPKHGAGDDQAQERNPTEVEAPNAVQHIAAERWMEIDQGPNRQRRRLALGSVSAAQCHVTPGDIISSSA